MYEKFSVLKYENLLFISKPAYEVPDNSIQGIGSMDSSVFFIFHGVFLLSTVIRSLCLVISQLIVEAADEVEQLPIERRVLFITYNSLLFTIL